MAPKKVRQLVWGWKLIGLAALTVVLIVVLGRELVKGEDVGANVLFLGLVGVGWIALALIIRRLRRSDEI